MNPIEMELVEVIVGDLLTIVEATHNGCEIASDDPGFCTCEQYGDGNVAEHRAIREARMWLDRGHCDCGPSLADCRFRKGCRYA